MTIETATSTNYTNYTAGSEFVWPGPEEGERCNCTLTNNNPCGNCNGRGVLPIPLGCLFDKEFIEEQMADNNRGTYTVTYANSWRHHIVYNISPTTYPILGWHKTIKDAIIE
jgi:hypothetical protein